MSKVFYIAQNDSLPRVVATLGSEFSTDEDVPEEEKIVYNSGDEIRLYMNLGSGWVSRVATDATLQDTGKQVRVIVQLEADDVANKGSFDAYFRNETLKISFSYGLHSTLFRS